MNDDQKRSHAMQQLRAARELYSETGDRVYLAVIDAHLHTIAEVDARRRLAEERRAALLELHRQATNDNSADEAEISHETLATRKRLNWNLEDIEEEGGEQERGRGGDQVRE